MENSPRRNYEIALTDACLRLAIVIDETRRRKGSPTWVESQAWAAKRILRDKVALLLIEAIPDPPPRRSSRRPSIHVPTLILQL
ncbi:hypothetical protein RHMOL_RhmolMtG0007400 (mitochondrion) [Rhododendron molle]|nr:hypothetical protein RHMOL_RhmolMtG0007400 [Rhododendron molle]